MCIVSNIGDEFTRTIPQKPYWPNPPYEPNYLPKPPQLPKSRPKTPKKPGQPLPYRPRPEKDLINIEDVKKLIEENSEEQLTKENVKFFTDEIKKSKKNAKALKKDIKALKKLLKAAIEYDRKTGQPDCHIDEKVGVIKALAKEMGISMKGIFDE